MNQDDSATSVVIDPAKRYLLARPRGGFNDCLVQLDAARRHAERFGRTLVIDTRRSGLNAGFETLFVTRPNFGCPVIIWTPEVGAALDSLSSVQPKELAHRTSSYQTVQDEKTRLHLDAETKAITSIDLKRDHPETLLVQERVGGGLESLRVLRRMSLCADVATEIVNRLRTLGDDYDAVHIRHSDYRTDFEDFLRKVAPVFTGRKLLICTDSAEVKEAAPRLLGDRVEVISIAEPPDTQGQPLHLTELTDRHAANLDLLTEIFAMVRSRNFLFTQLDRSHLGWNFSGFAKLVAALRAAPDTFDIVFANCDPSALQALRSNGRAAVGQDKLVNISKRWLAKVPLQIWNRKAIRQTRKIRKRVKKDLL